MIKHLLKSAFRSFSKRKIYFLISIVGLAFSAAVCLMIFLFINHESSFDKFHSDAKLIYRIQQIDFVSDDFDLAPGLFQKKAKGIRKGDVTPALSQVLLQSVPEIEEAVRFGQEFNSYIQKDGKWLKEIWHFADSGFFEMFSFPLIRKGVDKPLSNATDLVISQEMAIKYFGRDDVIGEFINVSSDNSGSRSFFNSPAYEIVAVVDVPDNSSIQFDFLFPIYSKKHFGDYDRDPRTLFSLNSRYATFLKINEQTQSEVLIDKINSILVDNNEDWLEMIRERRKLGATNPALSFDLTQLGDIHYDTITNQNVLKTRSKLYPLILGVIAFLMIGIVCVNCVTLNISTIGFRGKELGIRKVIGAAKRQLISQFYIEALLQLLISLILSITLLQFLIPSFNNLVESNINLVENVGFVAISAFLLIFILSFLIGIYPVIHLSKSKLVNHLNGWSSTKIKPTIVKGVIGFQFAIAMLLFILLVNMKNQFFYLLNKDMGFDKDQVVIVEGLRGKSEIFKSEIQKLPSVQNISLANSSLFASGMWAGFWQPDKTSNKTINVFNSTVDEDFFETLKVGLDSGRLFLNTQADAEGSVLVNRTFYDLISKTTDYNGRYQNKRIVGIIEDFNFRPLTFNVEPQVINLSLSHKANTAYIKLAGGPDISKSLSDLEKTFNRIYPERDFESRFMSDRIEMEYGSYQQMVNIISYASGLTILLACMGLFGLMGILVLNRIKEVGIRKILGASSSNIYFWLSKDLLLMVVLAGLIVAYPSHLIVDQWLTNFAYTNSSFILLLLLAIGAITTLCLAIVSFHTVRTSRINPVTLLRDQ